MHPGNFPMCRPGPLSQAGAMDSSTTGAEAAAEAGQSAPAASRWLAMGTVTAHAAAIVAFSYALMSLYWALGGHALVSTVGGYAEQFAGRGGALPVLIALAATLAKAAGGLLALALVRPRGRVVPRRWLLTGSAGASALLVVYGGLNVLFGALVLSGVIHPAGSVDRTALRWHVGIWDLWFLVWGILLALATVGYWRRTATACSRHRLRLAPCRSLRVVMRSGSGRRGAALVPDDGDRLPLGEPGAGGDRLIEPAVT